MASLLSIPDLAGQLPVLQPVRVGHRDGSDPGQELTSVEAMGQFQDLLVSELSRSCGRVNKLLGAGGTLSLARQSGLEQLLWHRILSGVDLLGINAAPEAMHKSTGVANTVRPGGSS